MKVRFIAASAVLGLGMVAVAPLTAQAQTDTTYEWMAGSTPTAIARMTDITAIAAGNGSYYAPRQHGDRMGLGRRMAWSARPRQH
jgi:hypothetical protein